MSNAADAEPVVYECETCGKPFLEDAARGSHRARVHDDTDALTPPAPFTETYEDSEFIAAVAALSRPFSRSVANRVGCHPSTARERLNALRDAGEVTRDTLDATDNGTYVWGLP